MKTIGAKELRLHLDEIFDRVLNGEDVIVHHRFKEPIKLSAVHAGGPKSNGKLAGLRAFDSAPKRPSPFDPMKSVKELYSETISKKHFG
jgi:hypothetical protein